MQELQLRDVQLPPAPTWWPPAPGWWLLAALVLLAAGWAWFAWRRYRRGQRAARLFDATLARCGDPAAQVAAMSELLRRVARLHDPSADTLHGQAWLDWLDRGREPPRFGGDMGALLLEGAFRPTVTEAQAARLHVLARERFIALMVRAP